MTTHPENDPKGTTTMASKLKRVSETTDTAVTELAHREGRTFVAQLDRVVNAGLEALGERPKTTTKTPRKRAAPAPK